MRKIAVVFYLRFIRLFSGSGLYRFSLIRSINKKLLGLIKSRTAKVNGYTLELDHRDSLNLSVCKAFEPFETEFFKKNVAEGNVVLDIGANVGYYTILFSRLTARSGKVYAFEPDRELFPILCRNIKNNSLLNAYPENAAVSDRSGRLKLFCSSDKGDQRVYDSNDNRSFYEVDSVSIDQYFPKKVAIDWVKMDIQGAEGFALTGMRETVISNRNIKIVSEFWPSGLEKSLFGAERFLQLIMGLGFHIYELNEETQSVSPVAPEYLLSTYTAASGKFTNIFLTREASYSYEG